jgi:hypothetical protein
VLIIALSVALLASASPSPAPSPVKSAAQPMYVGPPGWDHVKGTSDGLGTWLRPGDTGYSENVIVERKDGFPSLDALLTAEVNYISSLPDRFGYAPVDTTVCGKHPAKYLSYTYTSSTGVPVTSEVVIAVFGTTAYSANYSKTITQWADPAAESSLTTICGREK